MKLIRNAFSPTCLIVSVLLLVYILYRSEIIWSGENRDYYTVYYIISLILIIFSIITFYINEKIKTYLIITLSSITFALYLFEGYAATYGDIYYGDRSKMDKHSQLAKDIELSLNEGVFFAIPPMYYEEKKIYSLSGISNVEIIACNENNYYSFYKSDRYGFNNPDNEWDKKDIEFFLIGDAFIHGQCVNRPHDVASVLRTVSKKSALNLGYRGAGPLTQYAILREYLRPGVKYILWFYFERRYINNLENELKSPILLNYIKDPHFTQNLAFKQNVIDEVARKEMKRIVEEIEDDKLIKFIKLYRLRTTIKRKISLILRKEFKVQTEFKEILKQANNLAIKNNSKLYFVYLPNSVRYKLNYNDPNYQSVKKIIDAMNIPFIDIHKEVMEKEKNPLELFPPKMYGHYTGHYTVEGYRKISEKIYQIIEK